VARHKKRAADEARDVPRTKEKKSRLFATPSNAMKLFLQNAFQKEFLLSTHRTAVAARKDKRPRRGNST
jgi:hypothetical protein